jgi:exodeoxyribonuclease VII large subunit
MNWIKLVIKGQEVNVGFDENSIHIYNAFPIKDDLKMRGYRWDPADKSWFVTPDDPAAELEALKNDLNPVAAPAIPNRTTDLSPFPHSFSVTELRNRIDRLIKEGIRGNIWIRGVVASEIKNYRWASYFDLRDEQEGSDMYFRMEIKTGQLDRVNFRLKELGIAEGLEKDLPVFLQVEVHLSLRNVVDIRLSVLDILPEYTQSKLRSQRDITLDKLKSEAILDNQKRLTLPLLISRMGLITSEQGTSISDIMAGLGPLQDRYQFYFLDTRMEGARAVDSIIYSIDMLDNWKDGSLDAIIIARGGGSEQSLAVFNDYRVCQRICQASIPVLTSIGHEKDLSAAEVCSHLTPTPSTPSGMGKYLQDRFAGLKNRLVEVMNGLIQMFSLNHNRELEKLAGMIRLVPSRTNQSISIHRERYVTRVRQFEQSAGFLVREQEKAIQSALNAILEKTDISRLNQFRAIRQIMESVLSRMRLKNHREDRESRKHILRLDFKKRFRENSRCQSEVTEMIRNGRNRSEQFFRVTENELSARRDLLKARDPTQVLKRGFTLTLDRDKRIVPSLKDFRKISAARLRFHDGESDIIRKEEK